ncbi:RusA family crossover junction endodeoxyribonuclease [Streptomyces olivaceus]|uniref:RusA family crossover junction endodeoxyribonuclease n=1 Tax=Streptomyces olivaceus TaxID=47716 RepID=UPI001CCD9DE2|nr:RusA family crossover junction endodeoxyribonuclease [Streptomyces olivaceus]MBZ6085876.1 RusA family crossover junction endodeoxyribonuclease [Streptomyces olivaceus]
MSALFDVEVPAAHAAAGPRPAPSGISLTVYGLPAPQGSKRHVGNGVMVESSKKVKPWRQDVKQAALDTVAEHADWTPLDGPLIASMVFTFARPKGHYRTGRNAHLLRDSAPPRPHGMPDLSKILRSTEDALTGIVWKDDARVVGYAQLGKHYAGTGAPDVLAMPGCVIRVWPLVAA